MQIFGLLSLLIVIGLGTMFVTGNLGPATTSPVEDTSRYQKALESAEDAAGLIEKTGDISILGKKIEVYAGISVSESTKILDLSDRGLSGSLKGEIRMLTKLTELDLSNNNFTGLPAEVGQLSKLEVLNLSNNPFTGLPYELGNLSNLKVFDLRGTDYTAQDLAIIKQTLPNSTQVLTD